MTYTRDQLDALGVSCDLQTAAKALGVSKSAAYSAVQNNDFPCRTLRLGGRIVVPTAELRALLLGETPPPADEILARLDRIASAAEELLRVTKIVAIDPKRVA